MKPGLSRLLAPAGLAVSDLERSLSHLLGPGVEAGDLYFQHSRREHWTIEDGIVKDGGHAIEQGVGVPGTHPGGGVTGAPESGFGFPILYPLLF